MLLLDLCQGPGHPQANPRYLTIPHSHQLVAAHGDKRATRIKILIWVSPPKTLSSWLVLAVWGQTKPGHRHSPVQSRGPSPCRQVEKDGPVRLTVSAVNSSTMSTPSACLDTQGAQPGQQTSVHGPEHHPCPPLQHVSLSVFTYALQAGPG